MTVLCMRQVFLPLFSLHPFIFMLRKEGITAMWTVNSQNFLFQLERFSMALHSRLLLLAPHTMTKKVKLP